MEKRTEKNSKTCEIKSKGREKKGREKKEEKVKDREKYKRAGS
jgi:hypothetical protein